MAEKQRVVGAFPDVDDAVEVEEGLGAAEVDAGEDSDVAFARDRGDSAEKPPDTTVAVEVDDPAEAAAIARELEQEGADVVEVDPAEGPTG